MGFFKKDKKGIPPHKLHPDVLHWKEGDEIVARNVKLKGWFSKIIAFEDGYLNMTYLFKAVTDDGYIIVEEKESNNLHKVEFRKFIKKANNNSLINRSIKQDLNHSKDYMELIDNFQQAYTDLEESDKPKLLE
jgi:hypothetical protein